MITSQDYQRWTLAFLSAGLLVGGVVLVTMHGMETFTGSLMLRAGLVLGAIWLAFPQLSRLSRRISWPKIYIGVAALLVIVMTKAWILLLPLSALFALQLFIAWVKKPYVKPDSKRPPN